MKAVPTMVRKRGTVAEALVRTLGGSLLCVDVVAFPTLLQEPTGMAAGLILTRERRAAPDNRRKLEARLTPEGVDWTWRDAAGPVDDCLTRDAILADPIVINTKRDDWRSARDDEEQRQTLDQRVGHRGLRPAVRAHRGQRHQSTMGQDIQYLGLGPVGIDPRPGRLGRKRLGMRRPLRSRARRRQASARCSSRRRASTRKRRQPSRAISPSPCNWVNIRETVSMLRPRWSAMSCRLIGSSQKGPG